MIMNEKHVKLVPPDGGWGWIAVIGVSLVNMATRSIEPSFGLLFGDLFAQLGVATTGAAFVMSTMDAMINLSGFLVGPICKYLSLRKVSILGSALNALGLLLTFSATSTLHILITYSIIGGIGTGLASSATFVVLNHYFTKKRGQAVGLSLAGTALGMMIFPQAVTLLLYEYGFRGAVLILGAINLHSIFGSILLQPVKWHMKKVVIDHHPSSIGNNLVEMETIKEHDVEDDYPAGSIEITFTPPLDENRFNLPETETMLPQKVVAMNGNKRSQPELMNLIKQPKKNLSSVCLSSVKYPVVPKNFSVASFSNYSSSVRRRKESIISNLSVMDFTGSSIQLHATGNVMSSDDEYDGLQIRKLSVKMNQSFDKQDLEIKPKKQSLWTRLYFFMDLDLLKDGIYLNLLLGLSLFYVAEQNFKMITPFFFENLGYSKTDTAFCLSTTAVMDVIARIILPPICDKLAPDIVRRKTIFMVTSLFLAIGRIILALQHEWYSLLVWFTICGFLRGSVLMNFTLIVSEWCPTLEKLPAAFGLQMVSKGIFVIALGPILGYIRDTTKSYQLCMITQCFLILLCVVVWTIEYIYVFCIKQKDTEEKN